MERFLLILVILVAKKGFVIEAGKLYSGLKDFPTQYLSSISTNKNVYVGINGIALGDGNFYG